MLYWILQPIGMLRAMLLDEESPRRIAWGIAFGLLIGLIPKTSILAFAIAFFVFCLRVNLGAVALSTLLFAYVGSLLDPITHGIGRSILAVEFMQPTYEALYSLPLAPWTGFYNTVTVGNLILGAALFYPVYRLMHFVAERYLGKLRKWMKHSRVGYAISAGKFASMWSGE